MSRIWSCKIGETDSLPDGSDQLMRQAVTRAYNVLTGKMPEFIFSGWGATLDEAERAVVEDRLPKYNPNWDRRSFKRRLHHVDTSSYGDHEKRIQNDRRSKYV